MVYADDTSDFEREVYYFCADSLSLPAFLEFSKVYEIEPQESAAESFNSIVSIFTKLGFSFKLDGAIVVGWPANKASRDIGKFLRNFDLGIPGYSVNEVIGLSKSPSICSSFTSASVYNDDDELKIFDDTLAQLYL